MRPKTVQITVPVTGYKTQTVTDEAVSVPAGAVGTVVSFFLAQKPIADSNGAWIGGVGNTSISFTSDIFDTEVAYKEDADLANGEYWIDYATGRARGRKADTATSLTITYNVYTAV